MEHTSEPWIEAGPSYGADKMAEVTEIVSVYGETEEDESDTICEFPAYIDKEVRAANARRIVACVNACRDMDISVLEITDYSIKTELDTLDEQIAGRLKAENDAVKNADLYLAASRDVRTLAAQRDELLAALTHAATDYIDQNGSVPAWWTDKIRKMVKPTCDELAKG